MRWDVGRRHIAGIGSRTHGRTMQQHLHTGPIAVLFAGVSAIVVINLVRLAAIWLDDVPGFERVSRAMAGLVTFGVPEGVKS